MSDAHLPGDRMSTAAIVTYVVLAQFFVTLLGVFGLVVVGVAIDPVALGLLGGLIGTLNTLVGGAVGFWIAGSTDGKAASAALAQLAGAGPAPPANPLSDAPAEPAASRKD